MDKFRQRMSGYLASYEESLETVKNLVNSNFQTSDVYYEAGILTFRISSPDPKMAFKQLYASLRKMNFIPSLRGEGGAVVLRIFPYTPPVSTRSYLPAVLLVATLATVFLDGVARTISLDAPLLRIVGLGNIVTNSAIFTVALMSIIGLHELGHKWSARIDGVESSQPYFLPGIPTVFPTFGAVIMQRQPLANKDDLFDIGISGPIIGFLVSLIVLTGFLLTTSWVDIAEARELVRMGKGQFIPSPFIFELTSNLLGKGDQSPLFTSLGFAAWLGMIVTSLNLLPVWQLDGGRIFRSVLSRRQHLVASYVAIGVLAVSGYIPFAILLLFLMPRSGDIAPLDQYSPLSKWRKISFAGVFLLIALTYVPVIGF